ncbi:MAG: hypothetical protein KBC84_08525 [Proteobacteria bacterium]|nr:hypothetical protein [Pseudomonadota bacterium]
MSSARQNKHIARLIVGAMIIDGTMSKKEREKVALTLDKIGMAELIGDVGAAIEEDDGSFNMFQECNSLIETLGGEATEVTPLIFRIVCDVIAMDRFVSSQEASYLSAMAKKLHLTDEAATGIFKQVLADRNSRLEVAGSNIDENIHPHLKKLLSFPGAENLVGQGAEGSIDDLITKAHEANISVDDVTRALTVLGLKHTAGLDSATEVWKETIDNLNLPKMANLGETFVSAALNRIIRINEAYKVVLRFYENLKKSK